MTFGATANENTPATGPKHDEAEAFAQSPPSDNPSGDPFNVIVSVPEAIQIKMVDASALADYEVWIFIASIISNAVVGFLVAYSQAIDAKSASSTYVGWTVVIFVVLFVIATFNAFRKRSSMQKKGRDIKLKTTSATSR